MSKIIAFYSYKGGVGRTSAVINVASLLASEGKRVIIVDGDLEAPSMEQFFPEHADDIIDSEGLTDLVFQYRERMRTSPPAEDESWPFGDITKLLYELPTPRSAGSIRLLTSGRRSGSHLERYIGVVRSLGWRAFYSEWAGGAFFENLRKQLTDHRLADIVLVDSRTGLSEIGSVFTQHLADSVIAFCGTNRQNLVGLRGVVTHLLRNQLQNQRPGRPLKVHVVPSFSEEWAQVVERNQFKEDFTDTFDRLLPDSLRASVSASWEIRIPYLSMYSYYELIAVGQKAGRRGKRHDTLAQAYVDLCEVVKVHAALEAEPAIEEPSTERSVPISSLILGWFVYVLRTVSRRWRSLPRHRRRVALLVAIQILTAIAIFCVVSQLGRSPEFSIKVSELLFDFNAPNVQYMEFSNTGIGTLAWRVEADPFAESWLTLEPTVGAANAGEVARVAVRVDRKAVPPGQYTTEALIKPSHGRPALIKIRMENEPYLATDTAELAFGSDSDSEAAISIKNAGWHVLEWWVQTEDEDDASWISFDVDRAALLPGEQQDIRVAVDQRALESGPHRAVLVFHTNYEGRIAIPIGVEIPFPRICMDCDRLDFGAEKNELQLKIWNCGGKTLEWRIETEQGPWLTLSPAGGASVGEEQPTKVHVALIDRSTMVPGPHSATLTVVPKSGDPVDIPVYATVPLPELHVSPTALNFGASLEQLEVELSNAGGGQVQWRIDRSALPEWLVVTHSSGVLSTETQTLLLIVDRSGQRLGDHSHVLEIEDLTRGQTRRISVSMQVGPRICASQSIIEFPWLSTAQTLTIWNCGSGTLSWEASIDAPWASVSPYLGASKGDLTTVTVNVDRSLMETEVAETTLVIAPESGSQVTIPIRASKLSLDRIGFEVQSFLVPTAAGNWPRGFAIEGLLRGGSVGAGLRYTSVDAGDVRVGHVLLAIKLYRELFGLIDAQVCMGLGGSVANKVMGLHEQRDVHDIVLRGEIAVGKDFKLDQTVDLSVNLGAGIDVFLFRKKYLPSVALRFALSGIPGFGTGNRGLQ